MKLRFSLFIIGIITILYACTSTDPDKNTRKIDRLLKGLVQEGWAAGISYSIEIDSQITHSGHYGYADLEAQVQIEADATFQIASVTKPITATAILQLVEAGKLSLTTTIDTFFTEFPNGNKISIYQLLAHTSGIPNWWEAEMPTDTPGDFPMCKQAHKYLERMKNNSLFEPGTQWAYSNSAYVLLGEIIEVVSGITYEEYLHENIFKPAGMHNTFMTTNAPLKPNGAAGYVLDMGKKKAFKKIENYQIPFSAGGLRSTPRDLMRFLHALESGQIISKKLFLEMTTYAKLKNGKPVYEGLFSPNGEPIRFPDNIRKFGYGLGFQILENFGCKVISHGGDIAGFNAVMMIVPHNASKLILLSNTENGIMPKLKDIEHLLVSVKN